jgi:hypothetical protein
VLEVVITSQVLLDVKIFIFLLRLFGICFHVDFIVPQRFQVLLRPVVFDHFALEICLSLFKVGDPFFPGVRHLSILLKELSVAELMYGFSHGQVILFLPGLVHHFDLLHDGSELDERIVLEHGLDVLVRPTLRP